MVAVAVFLMETIERIIKQNKKEEIQAYNVVINN